MYKNILSKTAALFILLSFSANYMFSQEEHCYADIQGAISPGDQLTVSDDKIWTPLWAEIEQDYSVRNRVSIQIDRDPLPANLQNATYTLNLDIVTWSVGAASGAAGDSDGILMESLVLNYDNNPLNTTDDIVFLDFVDAYKVEVTVSSIDVVPSSVTIPNLILKSEIYIDRLYKFEDGSDSNTLIAPAITSISNNSLATTGKVDVAWSSIDGAVEYDFEWVFYDEDSDQNQNPGQYIGESAVNNFFKNNATRITTKNISYAIQTLYPAGDLYFRVRAVSYDDGVRRYTKWSSDEQTNPFQADRYNVVWHEDQLNWQSQISFAEGGKNVPSVNYFDGSLRQRQSVTFSNAIEHPIVQQNIYDYLGRPTISVMASPDLEKSKLAFDPLFMVEDASDLSYTKKFITETNGCLDPPPPADPAYGSSKYYSPNNPDLTGVNKFIPDASGYNFSTTEYTPDLTGRIRRQSGVGEVFKLNTGHETQYFYGKASQKELNKLFGDQVGNHSHYQKNMVRDPNGQFSVSYVDANGRTIATALAGDTPNNTLTLENKDTPTDIQKDLLNNVKNTYKLTSSYPLTVALENEMTFTYNVDPKTPIFDCLPVEVCYDCIYDLTITINDNCGNVFNGGTPLVIEETNLQAEGISTLCVDPEFGISESFTRLLPVGDYKITKELSVSESVANLYLEDFLQQTTCIPVKEDIYQTLYEDTDFTSCDNEVTEEEAAENVGLNECEMIREVLLIDVHPGGLSAPYTRDEVTNDVVATEGLLFENAFQAYFPDDVIYINGEEELQVNMLTATEFVQYFNPSWPEYLIQGHDKFDCYESCIENEDIADFILDVQNTETYEQAITNGYINTLTCEPVLINADPGLNGGSDCENGDLILAKSCYSTFAAYELFQTNLPLLLEYWTVDDVDVISNFTFNTIEELVVKMNEVDEGEWMFQEQQLGSTIGLIINTLDTENVYGRLHISVVGNPMFYANLGVNRIWIPCPNQNYDIIDDFLNNINAFQCIPNSVVNLINQVVYCDNDPLCDTSFGKGCETDNNLAWTIYKNIYLTQQGKLLSNEYCNFQKFMTDVVNENYEAFGEPVIYQGDSELVLFPPDEVDMAYVNDQKAQAEAAMLAECEANCDAQADAWMSQLVPCGFDKANPLYNNIRSRLIAVCQQGCSDQDQYNPFGASTCITPTLSGDLSFEQVLSSISEVSDCDQECSPKMITSPAPLGVNNYFGNRLLSLVSQGEMDDEGNNCMCDNLVEMEDCYNTYIANNGGVDEFGSLSIYLGQFTSIDISQPDLDMIKTFCTNDCNALPQAVAIPAYLECDVCKDFDDVDIDATAFINIYSNTYACAGAIDTEEYYALRAIHLNYLYGFNLLAEDYNDFLENPNGYSSDCYMLCPRSTFGYLSTDDETTCEDELIEQIELKTDIIYENKLDQLREEFILSYMGQCVGVLNESFVADGKFSEYHFTLYYYDQAGNLVQTIPPQGTIDASNELKTPENYTFKTKYNYNTFNQVTEQISPDIDVPSKFWYDNVGRVVASQDGRQFSLSLYSYTLYDEIGRIIEVGEAYITGSLLQPNVSNTRDNSFSDYMVNAPDKSFVTRTYYDNEEYDLSLLMGEPFSQDNLRNRVATVTIESVDDADPATYDAATHYSYDITGNVKSLIQEIAALKSVGHGYKRIDYDYEYISGNVNAVYYQIGKEDQFTHRYLYDENNRLTDVKTSTVETGAGITKHGAVETQSWNLWNNEASYEYYDHGPLARSVLAEQKVQGCDYAYTLQGWIKGVNSSVLDPNRDMGSDGVSVSNAAKDALGYTLGYYDGDYTPIGGSAISLEATYDNSYFNLSSSSLYNGNIRNMTVDVLGLNEPIGYSYNYDQLHRLKNMEAHDNIDITNNAWGMLGDGKTAYATNYAYDANGNINNLTRNGSSVEEDNLTYTYATNRNRLSRVEDVSVISPNTEGYITGINDYEYDGVGNLIEMDVSGLGVVDPYVNTIAWTPYGKVDKVEQDYSSLSSLRTIVFGYGPDQNRIAKSTTFEGSTEADYYIRDAQGNVMAVYGVNSNGEITWKEQHIYGSSRLGVIKIGEILSQSPTNPYFGAQGKVFAGQKNYELSNHLGNTLSIINDRKIAVETGGNLSHYEPSVLKANDYFPFGQGMVGSRDFTSSTDFSYRYGFNGKEKDTDGEWGSNTHYDYGFRIYNPSIGKFLSVDPLAPEYPWYTPYQFAGNMPVWAIDVDGLEPKIPGSAGDFHVDSNLGSGNENITSPAGDLIDVPEGSEVFYGHDGVDWRAIGMTVNDIEYKWDSERSWFYSTEGYEAGNSFSYRMANIGSNFIQPFVNGTEDLSKGENPFKGLILAHNNHNGSTGSFVKKLVKDGVYQLYSDIKAGGQKREDAVSGMFLGVMSGGPLGATNLATSSIRGSMLRSVNRALMSAGERMPGAASVLEVAGKTFVGFSGEAVKSNPIMTRLLFSTPANKRAPWHGGCAEIVCLEKALNSGISKTQLKTATIRTVDIELSKNGDLIIKKACSTCTDILEVLEIGN